MPHVDLPYMVEMLASAGFVSIGFSGSEPIRWTDFRAWQEATQTDLTPWEAETLMQMSAAYAVMLQKAKDPSCPSPYYEETPEQTDKRRERVADFFRSMPTK